MSTIIPTPLLKASKPLPAIRSNNFPPHTRPFETKSSPLAIYIHWPFCRSICPYCHFNRYVVDSVDEDAWGKAFMRELTYWKNRVGAQEVVSIFFGGGTPSLMSPDLVATILQTIEGLWSLSKEVEITLEMNPTDYAKAPAFAQAGINRISMGVQSFHDETLTFLGRSHRISHIQEALSCLKSVGLRYSFDLIYGHKHHNNPDQWAKELELACPWIDDHLSLYQLSYESGTPFYKKRHQELSDEALLHLEELTQQALSPLGLYRYEVSNYAKPEAHSVHNRMYWTYQDFLGVGPGAHGRLTLRDEQSGALTKMATHNAGLPDHWMNSLREKGHGLILDQPLTREQRLQEQCLMGLRLREGLLLEDMLDPGEILHGDLIQRLDRCLNEGLLESDGQGETFGIPLSEGKETPYEYAKSDDIHTRNIGSQEKTSTSEHPELMKKVQEITPGDSAGERQGANVFIEMDSSEMASSEIAKTSESNPWIPKRLILTERGRCVLNSVVDYICQGPMIIKA